MRAFAFSLWVCALVASSPAIGQTLYNAQQVYDMWYDSLTASGRDELIDIALRCDSAEEMYMETGYGFGSWFPVHVGYQSINAALVRQGTTARLVWLEVWPVWVDTDSDFHYYGPFSSVHEAFGGSYDLYSPLVRSIIQYLPDGGTDTSQSIGDGPWLQRIGIPLDNEQPYGKLLQGAVRVRWDHAPIGEPRIYVRQAPLWYYPETYAVVTPQTFYQITHQWPDYTHEGQFIWLPDGVESVKKNISIRVKESWH